MPAPCSGSGEKVEEKVSIDWPGIDRKTVRLENEDTIVANGNIDGESQVELTSSMSRGEMF